MEDNSKYAMRFNIELFKVKPSLYICYFIMQLIWSLSPFISSYIIGKMFDVLEISNMYNYYFLTLILFEINIFSIYVIKKAGIVDVLITFFVGKTLKKNILSQIIKINKNVKLGEILDILDYDVETMEYMFLTQLDLLSQCVFILISISAFAYINIRITLYIVIPIIFITILFWKWCNIFKKKFELARQGSIDYSILLSEIINNRESAQFLGKIDNILKIFSVRCNKRMKLLLKKLKQSVITDTIAELSKHIGIIFILILFMSMREDTSFTVGKLVMVISFIGYAGSFLQLFNVTANGIKSGENSLERISNMLDSNIENTINYMFNGERNIQETTFDGRVSEIKFENFKIIEEDECNNFCIEQGQMVAITCDNNSGKTTLLNTIMGYSNYYGNINMNCDIKHIEIGYVSQQINLFDATIEENIILFKEMDEDKYKSVCKLANIDDEMLRGSKNIGVNGKELSEGQRQRVAIARALYNNSGLILLDDAFAYLDKDNRQIIINNLLSLEDTIIIYVTNDRQLVEKADINIYMDKLKIKSEREVICL